MSGDKLGLRMPFDGLQRLTPYARIQWEECDSGFVGFDSSDLLQNSKRSGSRIASIQRRFGIGVAVVTHLELIGSETRTSRAELGHCSVAATPD